MEAEARELFNLAEAELRLRGYEPVNPMALNHEHDGSWHSYMRQDVKALCDCDAIYMLTNWADSKGAIIEHTIAMYLGMRVVYEGVERVGINCQCPEGDSGMRSRKSILRECFLGVIDFNEDAALDAMKRYAELYHESKVKKILSGSRRPSHKLK